MLAAALAAGHAEPGLAQTAAAPAAPASGAASAPASGMTALPMSTMTTSATTTSTTAATATTATMTMTTATTMPATTTASSGGGGAARGLLLAAILQPLLQSTGSALATGVGDLIKQFFSAVVGRRERVAQAEATVDRELLARRPPQPSEAIVALQGSASPTPPSGTTAGGSPAATPVPTLTLASSETPGGARGLAPSLVFAIDQLDRASFTATKALELSASQPPVLHTGDVFAVRFATNLPGLLSIENTDAGGEHTVLGTYTVLPGGDNRYPRRRGLQLAGATGLEAYDVYFLPCIPAEARAQPLVAPLVDRLPACPPPASVARLSTPVAGRSMRSTVNLDSPDPTLSANVATGFNPADVVKSRFVIRHDP